MFFTDRQVAEEAMEHNTTQYIVFVNLKTAYDLVPCEALWLALSKLRVLHQLLEIIRSFHEGMKASLQSEGRALHWLKPFSMFMHAWWQRGGLQRCTLWKELECACYTHLTRSCSESMQRMAMCVHSTSVNLLMV